MTKREWFQLTVSYLGWRAMLLLLAKVAQVSLKYQPSFPYAFERLPNYGLPQFIYSWANFDGVHYLTIAERGYVGTALIQAFFPVYPFLTKYLNLIIGNTIISGLLLSTLFSFGLWLTWFYFLKKHFSQRVAWVGMGILFLFPTSFYFTALYTESLFLLLILWIFLLAEKQKWMLVSVLTMLLSATRVVGVFIIPALMLEVLGLNFWKDLTSMASGKFSQLRSKLNPTTLKTTLLLAMGSLGLFTYMYFLWQEFHDPLYFFHVQSAFGSGRQENLVVYPQVVWRYLKILLTFEPHNWRYLTYVQEAVVGTVGFVLLLLSVKKVKLSWWAFSVMAFLLPTLTGNFSSMPRYVLVCFPIFIWLALLLQNKRWFLWLYLLGSTVLLVINTMLFIQGYWVA